MSIFNLVNAHKAVHTAKLDEYHEELDQALTAFINAEHSLRKVAVNVSLEHYNKRLMNILTERSPHIPNLRIDEDCDLETLAEKHNCLCAYQLMNEEYVGPGLELLKPILKRISAEADDDTQASDSEDDDQVPDTDDKWVPAWYFRSGASIVQFYKVASDGKVEHAYNMNDGFATNCHNHELWTKFDASELPPDVRPVTWAKRQLEGIWLKDYPDQIEFWQYAAAGKTKSEWLMDISETYPATVREVLKVAV